MTPELEQVLRMLTSGILGQRYDDLVASLLTTASAWPTAS